MTYILAFIIVFLYCLEDNYVDIIRKCIYIRILNYLWVRLNFWKTVKNSRCGILKKFCYLHLFNDKTHNDHDFSLQTNLERCIRWTEVDIAMYVPLHSSYIASYTFLSGSSFTSLPSKTCMMVRNALHMSAFAVNVSSPFPLTKNN